MWQFRKVAAARISLNKHQVPIEQPPKASVINTNSYIGGCYCYSLRDTTIFLWCQGSSLDLSRLLVLVGAQTCGAGGLPRLPCCGLLCRAQAPTDIPSGTGLGITPWLCLLFPRDSSSQEDFGIQAI